MKNLMITVIAVFTLSNTGFSQLSGNVETKVDAFKNVGEFSIGGSLQYLFYNSMTSLPGVSAGVALQVDLENDLMYASFPVNFHYRHYIVGVHGCSGGLYSNLILGGRFNQRVKNPDVTVRRDKFVPSATIGLGIRTPMSYDFNVNFGTELKNRSFGPIFGFKLGYTF